MRFKKFLHIVEALAPEVREILLKAKFPVAQDMLAAAIKELEDKPELIKTAADGMQALRTKLGLGVAKVKQKAEIEEPTDPKLKPYYDAYKKKEITLPEYKTAVYFKDADAALLRTTLSELRRLIEQEVIKFSFTDEPVITFRDANLKDYRNLGDFASRIHDIESRVKEAAPAGFESFRDPTVAELENPGTQVWPPKDQKGPNTSKIWIFKGSDFFKCKYFGAGAPWCVTKSPANYMDYLERGQTQYFIYDFNKAADDPARYTNPGVADRAGASEYVDIRNTHPMRDEEGNDFGINGYNSVKEYKKYLQDKGVPVDQVLKAVPPDPEEVYVQNLAARGYDKEMDDYLPDLRKRGRTSILTFLALLAHNQGRLSAKTFSELSPEEKEMFMIAGNKKPDNSAERNYVENLSRKQAREYLDDMDKVEADIALSLRYDNKISDKVMQDFADSPIIYNKKTTIFLNALHAAELIGYKQTDKILPDMFETFAKSYEKVKKRDPYFLTFLANLVGLEKNNSNQENKAEKQMRFIKMIIANKEKLMRAKPDILSEILGGSVILQGNHEALRYFWSHLNDEEKKDALTPSTLPTQYSTITDIDLIKDAYRLVGKKEWMYKYPYAMNNLTSEDHDWVKEKIGDEPYKVSPYSRGVTSFETLKRMFDLNPPMGEDLAQVIFGYLQNNNDAKSFSQVLDLLKNRSDGFQYNAAYRNVGFAMLYWAVKNHHLDQLTNYVPANFIYNPTLASIFLRNYVLDREDVVYYFENLTAYVKQHPLDFNAAYAVFPTLAPFVRKAENRELMRLMLQAKYDRELSVQDSEEDIRMHDHLESPNPLELPLEDESLLKKLLYSQDNDHYGNWLLLVLNYVHQRENHTNYSDYKDALKKIFEIRPLPLSLMQHLFEHLPHLRKFMADLLLEIFKDENFQNIKRKHLGKKDEGIRFLSWLMSSNKKLWGSQSQDLDKYFSDEQKKDMAEKWYEKSRLTFQDFLGLSPLYLTLYDAIKGFANDEELEQAVKALLKQLSTGRFVNDYMSNLTHLRKKYGDRFIQAVKRNQELVGEKGRAPLDLLLNSSIEELENLYKPR